MRRSTLATCRLRRAHRSTIAQAPCRAQSHDMRAIAVLNDRSANLRCFANRDDALHHLNRCGYFPASPMPLVPRP
ncbi:MAG: hypothetical protein EB116_10710 [Betaproteobacteria bacterium]|nr:hypothetical protein [Betaproteobacteria bacterium]